MLNPEDIINNSDDVRELKRALAVNMSAEGTEVSDICKGLRVSDSYVSKWKIIYEKEGAEGLLIKYKGSKGYPGAESRKEIIGYTEKCEHISTEELRDHIEEKYGVVYKSEQSYYDLLKAAGKSRHKSQKKNPKKNEERVILRREEIKKTCGM
jgi:transposase